MKKIITYKMEIILLSLFVLISSVYALNSGEWSNEILVGDGSNSVILSDKNETAYVIWQSSLSNLSFKAFDSNGDTIIQPKVITSSNGNVSNPSAAIDSFSRIHLVWEDTKDGNKEIYYMLLSKEGNILNETRITNSQGDSLYPSVKVNGNEVFILWSENTSSTYKLYKTKIVMTSPQINIKSPYNHMLTNNSNILLDVNFSEEVRYAWYSIDGNKSATYENITNITTNIPLNNEGVHNITITAIDNIGNINFSDITISYFTTPIDNIPPSINIISPKANTIYGDSILLNFTLSEVAEGGLYYSIDNGPNISITNVPVVVTGLSEGMHSLTIYAFDKYFNMGNSSVSFGIDVNPPEIIVTYPINNSTINTFDNMLKFSVFDGTYNGVKNITIFLNKLPIFNLTSAGNYTFSLPYVLGDNIIKIIAYDLFNHSSSLEMKVNVQSVLLSIEENLTADKVSIFNFTNISTEMEIKAKTNISLILNVQGSSEVSTLDSSLSNDDFNSYLNNLNLSSLNKYYQFSTSGINYSDLDYIILKFYYTIADLDTNGDGDLADTNDILPSSLSLFRYCDETNTWQKIQEPFIICGNNTIYVYDYGVNTTENYVWVNISKLSIYTLAGSKITYNVYGEGWRGYTSSGSTKSSETNETNVSCMPNYICGEWTECSKEGKQTRTCEDINKCGVPPKVEERPCSLTQTSTESMPPTKQEINESATKAVSPSKSKSLYIIPILLILIALISYFIIDFLINRNKFRLK